jgi:hypothetical protein
MTFVSARSSAAAPQKLSIIFLSVTNPLRAAQVNGASSVARLKTAGRCIVYLNERCDKRGCRTKWRFRNNLRYRHDTQWTAG